MKLINILKELVTNMEIICDNCGWRWKIKDGGDDLYICHKCNHDNTPEELKEEKTKRDRCLKIADRKFDKPSAYKSGAVVRCRKGDIWKGIKETDNPQSGKAAPYGSGFAKVKEEQLDESKQVGTIYHFTTFSNGFKILEANQLKSFETADSTRSKPIYGVSFTRNKQFHNKHNIGFDVSSFGQRPEIRFTVDGDKLSNNYKIQPYAQIGGAGRFEKQHEEIEAEERVVANKPFTIPILTYLKSIDILVEYKKPRKKYGEYDFDEEYNYRNFAPIRAEVLKFAQDNNIPINLIVNKNGDPWPDKIKPKLINKILNWFSIKETADLQSGKAAPYGSGFSKVTEEQLLEKVKETLRTWFARKGPKGKEGGWVDCNAPDGDGGYKACGRKEDEKRAKYPSCRPTAAQCKTPGKGTKWGKTK